MPWETAFCSPPKIIAVCWPTGRRLTISDIAQIVYRLADKPPPDEGARLGIALTAKFDAAASAMPALAV